MTADSLLIATATGSLAGWLADVVMQGGGYGVTGDIVGAAFLGAAVLIYRQRTLWHKNA